MPVWTIVVAAGAGRRFVAAKQFAALGGKAVVNHSVLTAAAVSDAVVLVLPPAQEWTGPPVDAVVAGGPTRSESVRNGLGVVPADADVIVIHDAVRPLASTGLFEAVIAAVRAGADAAIPGVAVVDTLKQVDGERVVATLDRDILVAVQTPQAFRASVLRSAHAPAVDATDDAALVEAAGGHVVVVPGETRNLKITTTDDLLVAGAFVRLR